MDKTLPSPADRFLPLIEALSEADLRSEIEAPDRLRMASGLHRGKRLDVAYAPFDHVNREARVVIVGITPGRQQMANALLECHRQLRAGADPSRALAAAKVHASFSGPMRANLVAMLDDIGVARLLGLETTAALWEEASDLVHFTSALRYPVFVDNKNYSGAPSMLQVPQLRQELETWFGAEMLDLRDALFVPLGPKVGEALAWLAPRLGVSEDRILTGLPHPSGASGERIAYFLGRKPAELLSAKTNATRLDAARSDLVSKISKLGA
ncbi:hypothetical protein [Tranquillimonas alkanivorans]|uniref:Uracil DNA glycosylase superfamily protein n=1 Tax=Tranquillimonas alkanivorans TaxID=441119 RepID=A0A1I5VCA5_9RHOB|nr:hypothetical protein [Tranquillimonas alkanivorans]SFQ05178.1 hypothetical protein SAMN04488047_12918 [Tranquillimonas alkanivorans]